LGCFLTYGKYFLKNGTNGELLCTSLASHTGADDMFSRIFLNHPASVEETYGQHARFAGGFALKLFAAACAAALHAVIPCLFEKTASRMVADLYARTHKRGK
jgi:hypothetical protein